MKSKSNEPVVTVTYESRGTDADREWRAKKVLLCKEHGIYFDICWHCLTHPGNDTVQ